MPHRQIVQSSNENRADRPINTNKRLINSGVLRRGAVKAVMLEILQNFERATPKLAPVVVILPGLAGVVVGLFIWLGGLGFKRPLLGLIGAIAGGIAGFFLVGHNVASIAAAAGIAGLIAIILDRVFIALLAAALVAAFGFMVLARPYLQPAYTEAGTTEPEIAHQSQPATVQQSIETVKEYAVDFAYAAKGLGSRMPVRSWAVLAAGAAVSAAAGLYLWRLVCALCCAALGTTLVFAGMILLLSYKGATPLTRMSSGSPVHAGVFLGMIAFGTVEQWLLFGRQKRQPAKAKKDEPEPDQERRSWRGM